MTKPFEDKTYSKLEEAINIYSHGLGFALSIFCGILLIQKAIALNITAYSISYPIYAISMIILYAASTLYHSAKNPKKRRGLKVFDHAAIYLLIAGSYTPLCMITLKDSVGLPILITAWIIAILGIGLKMFFTGQFKIASTISYLLMGWMVIFAAKPLYLNLPPQGFQLLLGATIAYTSGGILYAIKKVPYNHAIFHILVLIGSGCIFGIIHQFLE